MTSYEIALDVALRLSGMAKVTKASRELTRLERQVEKLRAIREITFQVNIAGWEVFYTAKRALMETIYPFSEIEAKAAELSTVLSDLDGAVKNPAVEVTKRAIELSKATSLAATEIQEAAYLVASAGITSPLIAPEAAEWTLKVARATRQDLATAAEVWAKTANQFFDASRMTRAEMERLSDVLTYTQQTFQLSNLLDLGYGMKYVGSTAKQMGLALEATAVALGVLNTAGIDGTTAGTGLKATLLHLSKAARELGFQIKFASDGSLDLVGTLRSLRSRLESVKDPIERMDVLQKVFGERAVVAVNALLQNLDMFEENLRGVSEATGVTERSFKKMESTTLAVLRRLRNNIVALFYVIGQGAAPMIKWFTRVMSRIVDVTRHVFQMYPILGRLTAGLLALGVVTGVTLIALGMFGNIITNAILYLKMMRAAALQTAVAEGILTSATGGLVGAIMGLFSVPVRGLKIIPSLLWHGPRTLLGLKYRGQEVIYSIVARLRGSVGIELIKELIRMPKSIVFRIGMVGTWVIKMLRGLPLVLAGIPRLIVFRVRGVGLGGLRGSLRLISSSVYALIGVISSISWPIIGLIMLVGTLATAWYKNWGGMRDKTIRVLKDVGLVGQKVFFVIVGVIRTYVPIIWRVFKDVVGFIWHAWLKLAKGIFDILRFLGRIVWKIMSSAARVVGKVIGGVIKLLVKILGKISKIPGFKWAGDLAKRLKSVSETVEKTKPPRWFAGIKKWVKEMENIGRGVGVGKVVASVVSKTSDKVRGTVERAKQAFGFGGERGLVPASIGGGFSPYITNYYLTQHFDNGAVVIHTQKVTPEQFRELMGRVFREEANRVS